MFEATDMDSDEVNSTTGQHTLAVSTTTESTTEKFDLSDYLSHNYIVIIIPSVFVGIFLIILFIILIKKIMNRGRFDPKQLETYSSVSYDDESIDEELETADDFMYTSCKLLVGGDYEDTPEMTNSEPEYDCMSVDVSVSANESSIVDWDNQRTSRGAPQPAVRSFKSLPQNFWRRS